MKIPYRPLFFAAILAALFLPGMLHAADTVLVPVAVFDFDAAEPKLKERGSQLALLVTTQLSTLDDVTTVERQDLAKILEEQELGTSGLVNPGTAARIGQLTGARVLVMGRLFTVAKETTVALKVMSTETGRVFGVAETFSIETPPAATGEKLGAKIAEILKTKKGELVAQEVTGADRVAQIKQQAAGRKLPTLFISIPEQHLGPRVIDPAAATEIGLILSQAGFTIVNDEGADRADFRIEGEAFSEAGIRRGGLIACKARVEIKVNAKEGGKVGLIDRQTTWAVDTAEHIAAKLALQKAGAELASRIAANLIAKK